MTSLKNEILNLFFRRPTVLNSWLCRYYPLTESHIANHIETINWGSVSSNENINWTEFLIDNYETKFEWQQSMCKNPALPWSKDFILKYAKKLRSREELSGNTGIPWDYDLINTFKRGWNWHWLVSNESVKWTEKMMVDFDVFDMNLSHVNTPGLWTEEFVSKYKDKFNWAWLCYNPHLPWTESFIDTLSPIWNRFEKETNRWTVSPWKGLSENTGLPWSLDFVKKYQKIPIIKPYGLYLSEMSNNEAIPWQDGIFEHYSNKWDWIFLSGNNGLCLNLEQIEKYKDNIIWVSKDFGRRTIALNSSLPWSEELIDKYFDKWYWHEIAMNTGIPWSEKIISKYRFKLDNYPLFTNPSIPWSLEFILKNEDVCFDVWNLECNDLSQKLWDLIFKPVLDDELVENILSGISNPRILWFKGVNKSNNETGTLSPLDKLVNDVLNLKIESIPEIEDSTTILKIVDKTKACIVKIANSSENEHIRDYMFLQDIFNVPEAIKKNIRISLEPIRERIIDCFAIVPIDVNYVSGVILRHIEQKVQYDEHRKAGGHIHCDFRYLDECRKRVGTKYLTLARLLVELERF